MFEGVDIRHSGGYVLLPSSAVAHHDTGAEPKTTIGRSEPVREFLDCIQHTLFTYRRPSLVPQSLPRLPPL